MRAIKKSSADQSVVIRIIDSTTFLPETAVEYDTAGIALWYRREGATTTAITEAALAALDSAHADGGIEHIGDGYYRLDLPDAAVLTGANGVMVGGTVTGMIVIGCYVHLVDYDPQDTVRLGLTALPNAAADAAGGLPISDAGGLDMDVKLANTNEVTAARMGALTDWINGGRLDLILDDVLVDTAVIGALGAGLTAVPWNPAWDAEVQSEVTDALNAYDPPTKAEQDAAFVEIKGATWSSLTDTLEHIRDKETDIETDTAEIGAAGAGLTAIPDSAGVATLLTRIASALTIAAGKVTVGTNDDKTGYSIGAGGIPVGGYAAGAITDAAVAADAEAAIAAAVKAVVVEAQGSITLQQAISIILSVVAGVTADAGATIKTPNGVADRVAATINASNERTAMTLTPSA